MPLVSQTFDQLLDFTRTSSATFVGSDGLVQSTAASVNLLLYTQQFDSTAWLKITTTVTANTTVAPDGTSTADTLTATAGAGTHYLRHLTAAVTASTAHAFSFYVKAGTHDFIQLLNAGTPAAFANFDLANGVVGTTGAKSTASITSADNGWYRCTVVFDDTAALTSDFRIYIVSSASAAYGENWTTAGTETVFLWGAQVEVGSAATTYTRNNGGFYPPRFDYDPVTLAAKGLLIEEQRTNLLTYSEQFDNAAWATTVGGVAIAPIVTANAATAPDGTMTADLVQFNLNGGTTSTDRSRLQQNVTLVVGTNYVSGLYLKAATPSDVGKTVRITISGATGGQNITLTDSYQRVGQDGAAAQVAGVLIIEARGTLNDDQVAIFLWGAQLEAGAFATSYIPTVASQVTRSRDLCSIVAPNFAPWYNQSEGTFVVGYDVDSTTITLPKTTAVVHDGTTNNRIYGYLSGAAAPVVLVTTGGVAQASLVAASVSANTVNQMAFAYRANDVALSSNGGAVLTDTSATVPTVDQLSVGGFTPTAAFLNGHIRSIRYYPTRLTNAQLQALTA